MYSMGLFPLITRPSGLYITDITDHVPVSVISNINSVKTLNLKKIYEVIRKVSNESLY